MDDNDAAPPVAVEGKNGGMSVERAMPLGCTGQSGPLFVASMRVLV
jgi:hypothetical protein